MVVLLRRGVMELSEGPFVGGTNTLHEGPALRIESPPLLMLSCGGLGFQHLDVGDTHVRSTALSELFLPFNATEMSPALGRFS